MDIKYIINPMCEFIDVDDGMVCLEENMETIYFVDQIDHFNLLLEKDLPETVSLDYLGNIQVGSKRVTIKPRNNSFIAQAAPLVFEY